MWPSVDVADIAAPVRVRFKNDGGKNYLRAELHLLYKAAGQDATKVTFDWKDDAGDHRESHAFAAGKPAPWDLKTGKNVVTRWVDTKLRRPVMHLAAGALLFLVAQAQAQDGSPDKIMHGWSPTARRSTRRSSCRR